MYYDIQGLGRHGPSWVGGWGFCVSLYPEWKELVADSELNQEKCNQGILTMGRAWLDGCGYNDMFDPDDNERFLFEAGRRYKKPLGPNARPLYEARTSLRIQWGEWGLEHITVPGNACGLDIERHGAPGKPPGGAMLVPHNVDSMGQAMLLMVVFTWFANYMAMEEVMRRLDERRSKCSSQSAPSAPTGSGS